MNLPQSLLRLPESVRGAIAADRLVAERIAAGEPLERILASAAWASAWTEQADYTLLRLLKLILSTFAATPFELDAALRAAETAGGLTGAEVRVGLARLRRSGILFAVRKAWGDRLFYLPVDNIALWQPLLLPLPGEPLPEGDSREVEVATAQFRLPLSLQLLLAWSAVQRRPLTITAKGGLHRTEIAGMVKDMSLTPAELAFLKLSYPQSDQLPPQASLALDIGLRTGFLRKAGSEINAGGSGKAAWLSQTPPEADLLLDKLVAERIGAAEPAWHLTAAALRHLPASRWFADEAAARVSGDGARTDEWLALYEAFGWLERGTSGGKAVFRKTAALEPPRGEPNRFYVQPDGEIVVTPDAELSTRWTLELIAERKTADALFVYRLTEAGCAKAHNAGYGLEDVAAFLERGAAERLPEPVAGALADWFARLGKTKLAEVTLLRTASAEVAELLLRDPETAALLLERIGDRDFIVERSACKQLGAKLQKFGYPLSERTERTERTDESDGHSSAENAEDERGWINVRHAVTVFDADKHMPDAEQLFPGVSDIPASWIVQPRQYHVSTRKELIQRAIGWQASVQLGGPDEPRAFVPKSLVNEGPTWRVVGQWRLAGGELSPPVEPLQLHEEQFSRLMILLPSWDELQTD